jgi:hypothetical protein
VLFEEPQAADLGSALERVAALRFDPVAIRASALRFARDRHVERMREVVDEVVAAPAGSRW